MRSCHCIGVLPLYVCIFREYYLVDEKNDSGTSLDLVLRWQRSTGNAATWRKIQGCLFSPHCWYMICMLSLENLPSYSQLYKQHAFTFISEDPCPKLFMSQFVFCFFTYFSASMKLRYHLPLWFNPCFQCSQSFLHLSLAEINTGESAPYIYFIIHLFSCRRRCSWRKWGKRGNRNWQWIFHDETRSTGNALICMCFSLLLFLVSSAEGFFVGWSDNAVMAMIF